ncbi:MAG TPA: hypothetical protein VJJ22_01220 [Candidatus Paceibacterota bacterium]
MKKKNKDSKLMLDVGQANEFKLAARRVGMTNEDIKRLTEGDLLYEVKQVLDRSMHIHLSESFKKKLELELFYSRHKKVRIKGNVDVSFAVGEWMTIPNPKIKIAGVSDALIAIPVFLRGESEYSEKGEKILRAYTFKNKLLSHWQWSRIDEILRSRHVRPEDVYELLMKQPNGEKGFLSTSGYNFIRLLGREALALRWMGENGWFITLASIPGATYSVGHKLIVA